MGPSCLGARGARIPGLVRRSRPASCSLQREPPAPGRPHLRSRPAHWLLVQTLPRSRRPGVGSRLSRARGCKRREGEGRDGGRSCCVPGGASEQPGRGSGRERDPARERREYTAVVALRVCGYFCSSSFSTLRLSGERWWCPQPAGGEPRSRHPDPNPGSLRPRSASGLSAPGSLFVAPLGDQGAVCLPPTPFRNAARGPTGSLSLPDWSARQATGSARRPVSPSRVLPGLTSPDPQRPHIENAASWPQFRC